MLLGPSEEDEQEEESQLSEEEQTAELRRDEDLHIITVREAHVVGEELVVDCPLVGEGSSLQLSLRSRTYEVEGTSDVAGWVRHDEGSADD